MLYVKDFSFFESQNTFDFKGFLIKTGSYWRWFILGLIICLTVAHQINIRKQKIYSLESTIAVKEENNPFFTSNTSLVFNWGGTSDQVQTLSTSLKSRSHNELVVDRLQFYIDYLQQKEYYVQDIYGSTPFVVNIEKDKNQLLNIPVTIKFVTPSEYELRIPFASGSVKVMNYLTFEKDAVKVQVGDFAKRYKVGQPVTLPFLNLTLDIVGVPDNYVGSEYMIKFNNFDDIVTRYKNLNITVDDKAGAILKLSLEGTNKNRIVDYLNETVATIKKKQLDNKNLFAENTIKFIDTTLKIMENDLKLANNELKDFSRNNDVAILKSGSGTIQQQLQDYDLQKDLVDRKINYYNTLSNYLRNSNDFSKLPAPSVAGIEDPNVVNNVANLIGLSVRRSEMAYSVKNGDMFNSIDNEISSVKRVLLENINAAKAAIQYESSQVNRNLSVAEGKLRGLPEGELELSKIIRKYDLSNGIYQTYLQKRNEALIVKAANLSDIQIIDPAKDIGSGLIGPRTEVNYVIAIFLGLLIPLLIVFLIFFINNSIQNTDDINSSTQIPLIGVVGMKHSDSNLAVYEKPKSALSESFRAIRSSLQFLYKKQKVEGTKTLMLTSSVSGEGKTFCTVNIATVFAMSEKKTVIVGFDLRKPKIFDDFNLKNEIGVVNYLIGQLTIDEVINKTQIPFLDVITSGPVPPNPSELIMGETMGEFMAELKERYDYIILDTPPVGLVTDAVELSQYADVTLYITRQNFTKKEMIKLLNNRVGRGELSNVSIILNGFENKAKYGAGYGYGYGYGYGAYSNGYHEDDEPKNIFVKWFRIAKKILINK